MRLRAAVIVFVMLAVVGMAPATPAYAFGTGTYEVKNVATGLCLVADYRATYSWPCGTHNQKWVIRVVDFVYDLPTYGNLVTMENTATHQCLYAVDTDSVATLAFCDPEDTSQLWIAEVTYGCPGFSLLSYRFWKPEDSRLWRYLSTDYSRRVYLYDKTFNQRWYDSTTAPPPQLCP
jgi:hypothetical protein